MSQVPARAPVFHRVSWEINSPVMRPACTCLVHNSSGAARLLPQYSAFIYPCTIGGEAPLQFCAAPVLCETAVRNTSAELSADATPVSAART